MRIHLFVGCQFHVASMYLYFESAGWLFKPEKSSAPPSQRVRFLGHIINTLDMNFKIPDDMF